LVFDLAEPALLTREIIERTLQLIGRHTTLSFPDLLWSLEQGPETRGESQPGRSLPQGADIAWTLLSRAAAALPALRTGLGPEIEWASEASLASWEEMQQNLYDKLVSLERQLAETLNVVEDISLLREEALQGSVKAQRWRSVVRQVLQEQIESLGRISMQSLRASERLAEEFRALWLSLPENLIKLLGSTDVMEDADQGASEAEKTTSGQPLLRNERLALRTMLTDEAIAADPELVVRLAGALCHNRGTLAWETCLALANSRARYHRYITADDRTEWHIRIASRPGPEGTLEIPFAVIEQPLSVRFRQRFEAEDLEGRLHILWQLVQYAARLHASILTLTASEVSQQVDLREEELWNLIKKGIAGTPPNMEEQTP
jgi:hypothetical protein